MRKGKSKQPGSTGSDGGDKDDSGSEQQQLTSLLNEKQAAKYLGISFYTLQKDRRKGTKPVIPFVRIRRNVRYDPNVLKDLIRRNEVR